MRIRFITSTPLDIRRGSGTYVGIQVLAGALRELGHDVAFETPWLPLPVYTAERILFNRTLRPSADFDATVGFDLDGYAIAAGNPAHSAALKGVIADEARFERGVARFTMQMQAARERLHVQRAARVIVTSRYSGSRARQFYGLTEDPAIVPELIDLGEWRRMLELHRALPRGMDPRFPSSPIREIAASARGKGDPEAGCGPRFTVLFTGRLYRRKRVDVLLHAAAALRERIPMLEVRIVGDGPCRSALHAIARSLKLEDTVSWLASVPRSELAAEYNRADVFCLPSAQEGFGIVLLEAMAAGKPIVASRAGAIPEVAPHASLVEPDEHGALAAALEELWLSPDKRAAMARDGASRVELFDAPRVARQFLAAILPGAKDGSIATSARS